MLSILDNSKTKNYSLLKETILSPRFPWFYSSASTVGDDVKGHLNMPVFSHTFVGRPEMYGWSTTDSEIHQLAINVVREIMSENQYYTNEYFILRLASNCVVPRNGIQFSSPHIDHKFPHYNLIVYLTNSGGSTFIEGKEHKPEEDQAILFTGEHYIQLPKKERRIVLVATIFPLDEKNLNLLKIPYLDV